MAYVQFNEEQEFARANIPQSFITRLALSTGIVQTEQGVQYLLFGVMLCCIIATMWILSVPAKYSKTSTQPSLFELREMYGQQTNVPLN